MAGAEALQLSSEILRVGEEEGMCVHAKYFKLLFEIKRVVALT